MKTLLAVLTLLFTILPSTHAQDHRTHTITFQSPHHLKVGSEVHYQGILIGTVTQTLLHGKLPAARIRLNKNAPVLTDTDSIQSIATTLLGERTLSITPSQPPGKLYSNRAIILAKKVSPQDINQPDTNKTLHIDQLKPSNITGRLGKPLLTLHLIKCQVIDLSFTRRKADQGKLGLQILTVGGKPLSGKPYFHMPELPANKPPKSGQTLHLWVYETIETVGFPTEAFAKLNYPTLPVQGIHLRPKLVVLKHGKPTKKNQQ